MMIFWLTCLVGYPRTSAPEPESYKKSLTGLAKAAEEGDLDAIKLLNECIQDSQELKLRKELFGV